MTFVFLLLLPIMAHAGQPVVSAGSSHSIMIKSDGTLWGWGLNNYGQLGLGDQDGRPAPVRLNTSSWNTVSAGSNHTVAIKSDGTLWAWGYNQSGQLAYSTNTSHYSLVPRQIDAANTWAFVSAGPDYSMAIKSDGTLWTWGGLNSSGQSGLGTASSAQPVPLTQVGLATDWELVSTGSQHCLALKTDGSLWAWGNNSNSRLGDDTTTSSLSPKRIGSVNNWISIVAGSSSSFAVRTDGSLWAWGDNTGCQLGYCGTMSSPTKIIYLSDTWIQLMPGGYNGHVLGIRTDGTLWAWGNNQNGQLGTGYYGGFYNNFSQIGTDTNWAGAATGGTHTVALKLNGAVFDWGNNGKGQLGFWTYDASDQLTPRIATPIKMAGGYNASLAIASDGTLWGWGSNYWGQLGLGSLTQSFPVPTQIGTDNTWLSVSTGSYSTLALKSDGTLWQMGKNIDGYGFSNNYTPSKVGSDTDWVEAVVGVYHALALKRDGTLWAWGKNNAGELGTGTTTLSDTPVMIAFDGEHSGYNWSRIAAGGGFSAAIRSDGTFWGWGSNYYGPLADGSSGSDSFYTIPRQIDGSHDWNSVAAGSGHLLAARGTNHPNIAGAGYNSAGQLGVDPAIAERLTSLNWISTTGSGTAEVRAGDNHSLSLYQDGTLSSWGYDFSGQLGYGCAIFSSDCKFFTVYTLGSRWAAVAAGQEHTLGQKTDGTLWGWGQGFGSYGQGGSQIPIGTTPQYLNNVAITSSNTNPTWAKVGDTVTLSFISDAILAQPSVTIAGHTVNATRTDASGMSWTANHVMTSYDTEGTIGFSIRYMDPLSGQSFPMRSYISNGSNVTFDRSAPVVDALYNWPEVTEADNTVVTTVQLNNSYVLYLNGYVSDSGSYTCLWTKESGPGEISFSNANYCQSWIGSLADGSYVLRLTVTDYAGNTAFSKLNVLWDSTPPAFSTVHISSDNSFNSNYAKTGDTISLAFTTTEPIKTPQVTILGHNASITGSGTSWTAKLALNEQVTQYLASAPMPVTFSLAAQDIAGNNVNIINTTDLSAIIFDKSVPVIQPNSVSITSTNASPSYAKFAKVGDTVTLSFSASEAIVAPHVTIAGHSVLATNSGDNNWSAGYVMTAQDTEGVVPFIIPIVSDSAGNQSTGQTTSTFGNNVTFDKTAPTVSAGSNKLTQTVPISQTGTATDLNGVTSYQWSTQSGPQSGIVIFNNPNWLITNMTPSIEGDYVIRLTATDMAGNSNYSEMTLTWDKTPPSISLSPPSLSLTQNGPITYTVTYTGASEITLSNSDILLDANGTTANGTAVVSGTGTSTRTVTISNITGDGSLKFSITSGTARDLANNINTAGAVSSLFNVDNTAPTFTISAPLPTATKTSDVTYTVTYSGYESISLSAAHITVNKTGTATNSSILVSSAGNPRTVTISGIFGNGTLGISIDAGTASDQAGNLAAGGTGSTCIVDNTAPTVQIMSPLNLSSIDGTLDGGITGTASDSGSGVVKVELLISKNGTTYYYPNASAQAILSTSSQHWFEAEGTTSWKAPDIFTSFPTSGIGTYTITARATDASGNSIITSVVFYRVNAIYTEPSTITMDLSSTSIPNGNSISISGKLSRYCPSGTCNPINLSGRTVTLTVKKDGVEVTGAPINSPIAVATTSIDGSYTSLPIGPFSISGTYTIQATYAGTTDLQSVGSSIKSVLVGKPAGYAVIIEGRLNGDTAGTLSHTKSARRIYKTLKERNFTDDNIYWFNQGSVVDPVTGQTIAVDDTTPTVTNIGRIISSAANSTFAQNSTLAQLMLANPAPLYIFMVDHGGVDKFYLGSESEVIIPEALAGWLDTLDSNLSTLAKAEKKIIVIGSCYSGSFISKMTNDIAPKPVLSAPGRIIVTSASSGEQSYQGGYDGQDSVRSGEYFLDEFIAGLKRFDTIRTAFGEAATKTWAYTRNSSLATNGASPVAAAVQHPLLDDNGDGIGSIYPSDAPGGDGAVSSTLYLGASPGVNSVADPADLKDVADTIYLDSSSISLPQGQSLWARAINNSEVSSVWVELVRPSLKLTATGGIVQLARPIASVDKQPMTGTNTQYEYTGFSFANTPGQSDSYGKYEAYYYAIDIQTGNPSPSKRSIIYKDHPNNLHAPEAVTLVEPDAGGLVSDLNNPGSKTAPGATVFFQWKWDDAIIQRDPDGDAVTYRLEVCRDAGFTSSCIIRDELTDTAYLLSGLSTGTQQAPSTYFWRVVTVDAYGKRTPSTARSFSTVSTNPVFPVMLKLSVAGIDGTPAGKPLGGAAIILNNGSQQPISSMLTDLNGLGFTSALAGNYTLNVSATGYQSQSFPVTLVSGIQSVTVYLSQPVTHTLAVTWAGAGSGSISNGLACLSGDNPCGKTFTANEKVTLHAAADWKSFFGGWNVGNCSVRETNVDLQILMNSDKTVSACFIPNNQAKVMGGADYSTVTQALAAAPSGSEVRAGVYTFQEPEIIFNRPAGTIVTLDGGWNSSYVAHLNDSSVTTIDGAVKIRQGTLNVKRLVIR